MSDDNEIKVALTADLAGLQAGMEAAEEVVTTTTEAITAAVEESAAAVEAAQEAIVESATASAEAVAVAMKESAAAVEATQAEIMAAVAAEAAAFNAAVQAKIVAQTRLNGAFAGSITSTAAVAEAEAALDEAMSVGAITATEYAGYVERLDAAELEMAASVDVATVAVEENTSAMVLNAKVSAELGTMLGEVLSGNIGRLRRSGAALANQSGLLTTALQFLISPAGLAADALAGLAFAAYEAADDKDKLREAIINTGNASGFNTDQMRTMEQALRDTGATAAQAREAVLAVASAGDLLGANFKNAAQAAVDMAQLTGISIDKAVAQISRLQEDPVKAIMKLNETMNFLSPTEAAEIKHLQDIGDKAGAASLAIADLAEAERKRIKEQNDDGGGASSFTSKMKADASAVWAGAKNIFAPDTLKEQLGDINKIIAEYAADSPGAITQDDNNKIHVDKEKMPGDLYEQVNRLLQQRAEIEAKITAEDEKQQAVSAQVAANKAQVNAALTASKPKAAKHASGDHDQAQGDRDAYNDERLAHSMSLADEKQYWQAKKDAAKEGTQAYRQAVQQLLEIKDKEATGAREATRREVTDAKQAAAERVQAEQTVEREKERAAEKTRQLSLETLKDAHDEASRTIANTRERYGLEYSEGSISAQRLLEIEQGLVAQKLASDKKYYAEKEKLDATEPLAVQKDEAAIVKAMQDAQSAMMRAEKEFHANSEQQWKNYAKKIEGAMQGAINGMLFQHQTLRKAVANVAMVMGEDFIQSAIQAPLEKWIAAEGMKLSATIATLTGQGAATTTQRAADGAADAAASIASVIRASGVAGAQGTASFAGAPWPVDMGAPAFGAGMALAAMSYGSMASAAGGWERVPFDGAVTELHRDEMVLPKHIADPMRQMAMGGGQRGGAGTNITINAVNAHSITEMFRRDIGQVTKLVKFAQSRGHLSKR